MNCYRYRTKELVPVLVHEHQNTYSTSKVMTFLGRNDILSGHDHSRLLFEVHNMVLSLRLQSGSGKG